MTETPLKPVELKACPPLDLEELPEQIQSLRNHAEERRRNGWRRSADNLEASAYLIETLAAECAAHRIASTRTVDTELLEAAKRVTDCLVEEMGNLANEDETDDEDLAAILGANYARKVIAARLRIRQARSAITKAEAGS